MGAIVNAVLPVFGLILVGYLAAWREIMGERETDALNRFVVYLALPALLFQAMVKVSFAELANVHFLASFGGGMMLTFLVSFLLDRRVRGRLTDASIEGLAGAYPNTGFMGIALCLMAFGPKSLPPAIIASVLVVCVLMAAAIVLIEMDRQQEANWGKTLGKVGRSLGTNPILVSPLLGLAYGATGLPFPTPMENFTTLLGNAASPCALVTIGLFLAQGSSASSAATVGRLVGLKLVFQPVITALLAFFLFPMPTVWTHSAILLSALPIGTGPFMLAKLYERDGAVTSRAILLTTLGSVITISVLLALMHGS
jgi:malonate transporter